jgi:hypothetical protein
MSRKPAADSTWRAASEMFYSALLQGFGKIALRLTLDSVLQCDTHPRGVHALKPPNLVVEYGTHN